MFFFAMMMKVSRMNLWGHQDFRSSGLLDQWLWKKVLIIHSWKVECHFTSRGTCYQTVVCSSVTALLMTPWSESSVQVFSLFSFIYTAFSLVFSGSTRFVPAWRCQPGSHTKLRPVCYTLEVNSFLVQSLIKCHVVSSLFLGKLHSQNIE